jgi:hypothetical protein
MHEGKTLRSFLEIARDALREAQRPKGGSLDSAYRDSFCQAMGQIERVCPAGALQWAREAHPALTDKIDAELIPRLNDLWGIHAPLPEFQAALDELVRLHEDVGELFATELNRRRG